MVKLERHGEKSLAPKRQNAWRIFCTFQLKSLLKIQSFKSSCTISTAAASSFRPFCAQICFRALKQRRFGSQKLGFKPFYSVSHMSGHETTLVTQGTLCAIHTGPVKTFLDISKGKIFAKIIQFGISTLHSLIVVTLRQFIFEKNEARYALIRECYDY